jgi:acyl carrier protein
MSESEAVEMVKDAVAECLKRSGREVPEITSDTKIISGIAGFDSHCGIETTIELEAQLDTVLDDNVFIKEEHGHPRARTLREVAQVIVIIANAGAGHATKH